MIKWKKVDVLGKCDKTLGFFSKEFMYIFSYLQGVRGSSDVNIFLSLSFMFYIDSNWGTEKQEGEPYHNGNTDPRGYGE